jgi:hypothetical protein
MTMNRYLFGLVLAVPLLTIPSCASTEQRLFIGADCETGFCDGGTGSSFGSPDGGEVPTDRGVDGGGALSPRLCVSVVCPTPFDSCPTFNGTAPEYPCETNLDSDPDNCGACGNKCIRGTTLFHYERACVHGQCRPFCRSGYANCNGIEEDGCESEPKRDPNNCGLCGNKCPDGVACIEGKCGCPSGMTDCNGTCVDTRIDDANCGTCGMQCIDHQPEGVDPAPSHMLYGCRAGMCTELHCDHANGAFWSNCNGDTADGCEVDLTQPDADNCGKCGNKCSTKQECFSAWNTGLDCQCKGTKILCPATMNSTSFCADIENDPLNCGACNYDCPLFNHADATCYQGRCGVSCQPGYADCNGRQDDGCEVDLSKDPRNCGTCGLACDLRSGQPCVGGQCVTAPCGGEGEVQ